MPTYEYGCESCKYKFEKFQPITDKAVKKCPKCGKLKVKRLIGSGAGIIFRGSGFYQTDYRSKGYNEAAKKDSSAKADGAKPSDAKKTEKTPEAPKKNDKK